MRSSPKKQSMERAAIELFASRGISSTTIKDIASKAGVTEGALYRHYRSKEEMADSLFERELALVREGILHVFSGFSASTSVAQRLRAVISYLYASYEKDPYPLLYVILSFQGIEGEPDPEEKANIYEFIIERAQELFAQSNNDGLPLEFVSTLVTGVILQPILFHHYRKLPQHPVHYVDAVTEACCRMVGVMPEENS